MDMEEAFRLAQTDTQFIRIRKNLLYTFGSTRLPYVCLTARLADENGIIVRTGEVMAEKPQIAIPGDQISFEGFGDFPSSGLAADEGDFAVILARRISMPPSKYVNKSGSEKCESGTISEAIERVMNRLDGENDVRTGVFTAPEQVWGLSVLLYVGSQVARSAPSNVQEHLEHLRFRRG
ncbi:MAG: hypothetical protein LBT97_10775 [Planctomycetota bacterium]|jgi:hypothetical protein|nr:hypothetical protein [Planctomycetota bacterium]